MKYVFHCTKENIIHYKDVILYSHVQTQILSYYSGTSKPDTTGNLFLSFVKRCPLLRGLLSTDISDLGPRQKCPFTGVSSILGVSF